MCVSALVCSRLMLVVDSGGTTSCRNSPKGVDCTCAGVQRVKGLKKLLCKALETQCWKVIKMTLECQGVVKHA